MSEQISDCLSSGQRTFAEKVVEHLPSLRAFALSLSHNTAVAEDVVQQTVLKALDNQSKYTEQSAMKSWLFMILKNELRTFYRKKTRERPLDPNIAERVSTTEDQDNFEDAEEVASNFLMIVDCIAHLPVESRDTLIAIKYLNLSYEHTAFVLGVPDGTVKSRVSRAIESVRNLLSEDVQCKCDISAWETTSVHVRSDDPYIEIARAYESIYKFVQERERVIKKATPSQHDAELEAAWDKINLDEITIEDDVNDLIRDE